MCGLRSERILENRLQVCRLLRDLQAIPRKAVGEDAQASLGRVVLDPADLILVELVYQGAKLASQPGDNFIVRKIRSNSSICESSRPEWLFETWT